MAEQIHSHRDLVAWQKGCALGVAVQKAIRSFPSEERFGLTAQLRRAATSIASNIAEGYGRGTTADYLRFLRMARGSLYEIDTQLLFSLDFGYLSAEAHESINDQLNECGRVLAGLIRSIERTAGN